MISIYHKCFFLYSKIDSDDNNSRLTNDKIVKTNKNSQFDKSLVKVLKN